jgi:hypothetical protein
MFGKGPKINDPYNTMGSPTPTAAGPRKPGRFARLTELTGIINDFNSTWAKESEGARTPKQRRAASPAELKRIDQLNADHNRVMEERGREIGRLLKSGVPESDIRTYLDTIERRW